MERRIFGVETEFGVTCSGDGQRRMSADEVARLLFRKVVAWGRSSNVFLPNGSRLYLDVGSHPEYATAECDRWEDVIAQDRAGEEILHDLVGDAQERMAAEELSGDIYLFKNNTDSAGNSYGCHENYLVGRLGEFSRLSEVLLPFLVTRQIVVGAGKVLSTPRGALYCYSQRADHVWEGVSSATTRSRPIINTRDEPHADAELYRRLHVIVGDSSMAEPTLLVKIASTDLVLRVIEAGASIRDFTLENPIRAIREISHDFTGTATVRLASGRSVRAADIQAEYFNRVEDYLRANADPNPLAQQAMDLWRRGIEAVQTQDHSGVDTELDWAIKHRLISRYQERNGLTLSSPQVARMDLAYHDIDPARGLARIMEARGMIRRISDPAVVKHACDYPPGTTRAKLRGDFVRRAQEKRRDFTVDWVHLKLNDHTQRTVLCKDPFRSVDDRVERLIASL
ncbi:MAG: Pup--protein ligase [Micrococcales bacterium]|nr:MAG: Pup--protein ligase [Micrococcales bacterium]PIE26198.1 MAG: Pup--protein ligase [Micrococcales bacterium]